MCSTTTTNHTLNALGVCWRDTLDLVQARAWLVGSVLCGLSIRGTVKLAGNATQVDDHAALEEGAEVRRLLALRHADLGAHASLGRHTHGVQCRGTTLIGAAVAALPEVDQRGRAVALLEGGGEHVCVCLVCERGTLSVCSGVKWVGPTLV